MATFANGLSGPLLFDDQSSIVQNRQIRHLWPIVEALSPPADSVLASRPVVNLSFALNYAVGGVSPRGYHLVNLALHLSSALLLFGVVRRTVDSERLRAVFESRAEPIACAAAMLWMVHPLQTEPVNYVTQRTELAMGFFLLLTIYSAIRALSSLVPGRWQIAAVFACLIGAGCKESIASAPLLVVLWDRVYHFDSIAAAWRARWRLYFGLALSWLELAALIRSYGGVVGFSGGVSAWMYLMNQSVIIARYLGLSIWPRHLVLDYGAVRPLTLIDVLPQATLVASLLVVTVVLLARKPALGFPGAWFFVTLAPASSFVPMISEVGAERRMYLPLAALAVLVVVGGHALLARLTLKAPTRVGVATALVLLLAAGTIDRNRDYASAVRLLQTSVDRWPHGRVRFNLAKALLDLGRGDDAMLQLRAAVVDSPHAQYLLGSELYDRGRFAEAAAELRGYASRSPSQVSPDVIAARNLVALSLAQQGKLISAIDEFRATLSLDSENPTLHANLAYLLMLQHNFDGAREHYEHFLQGHAPSAFVLTNLGIALEELGHRDEARERFRQALQLDPYFSEARRRFDAAERDGG